MEKLRLASTRQEGFMFNSTDLWSLEIFLMDSLVLHSFSKALRLMTRKDRVKILLYAMLHQAIPWNQLCRCVFHWVLDQFPALRKESSKPKVNQTYGLLCGLFGHQEGESPSERLNHST